MAYPIRTSRLIDFSKTRMNQNSTMHERISSYAELQKLVHEALRVQHPEWISSDGESEMCEFYEARFAQLLSMHEN
jgi:hypothetical protein